MSYSSTSTSTRGMSLSIGAASPNAFGAFYQCPRDAHQMYSALCADRTPSTPSSASTVSKGSQSKLMKFISKN
ncbi:hypothetical protein CYLTODRAFT_417084 [Cylindrobasidium torrendii FP15055 ss-10]|uniref:Uncharacterized protein n=1 Tax=Cylindrobasidium torrendii FP15055 ss-10 TaxID=1314674 RepID=A0A0D7BS95_9AGAR|nr:hypothetical protein CYLTODRAFT_417084 [Cylindrobasidium torrendii FP15055 ss-10]